MAFIQPCFIRKNTPELRKKLEELGYKPFGSVKYEWYTGGYGLSTDNRLGEFESFDDNGLENIIKCCPPDYEDSIDCGTNENLFLSLAALRDDSDYMQWFVSTKTHTRRRLGWFGQVIGMDGHYKEIVGYEWHRHENKDNALTERLNAMIQMEVEDMEFLPHKATVEELIEHFKKD